jgi:hypothetical protein
VASTSSAAGSACVATVVGRITSSYVFSTLADFQYVAEAAPMARHSPAVPEVGSSRPPDPPNTQSGCTFSDRQGRCLYRSNCLLLSLVPLIPPTLMSSPFCDTDCQSPNPRHAWPWDACVSHGQSSFSRIILQLCAQGHMHELLVVLPRPGLSIFVSSAGGKRGTQPSCMLQQSIVMQIISAHVCSRHRGFMHRPWSTTWTARVQETGPAKFTLAPGPWF